MITHPKNAVTFCPGGGGSTLPWGYNPSITLKRNDISLVFRNIELLLINYKIYQAIFVKSFNKLHYLQAIIWHAYH